MTGDYNNLYIFVASVTFSRNINSKQYVGLALFYFVIIFLEFFLRVYDVLVILYAAFTTTSLNFIIQTSALYSLLLYILKETLGNFCFIYSLESSVKTKYSINMHHIIIYM